VIDTHAHLGDDAAEVLERAAAAGVARIVDVATTIAGARVSASPSRVWRTKASSLRRPRTGCGAR